MKIMFKFAAALVFYFASCSPAYSLFTVGDYEKAPEAETTKVFFAGLGNGFFWYNVALFELKQPRLYCQPSNISLGMDNYISIFKKQLADNPKQHGPEDESGMVLIFGLMKMFPCD